MLVPFNFLVLSAAIILSVTAVQVANGYSQFHLLSKRIDFLNIATLASSTHIAKDSNNYLDALSKSLEESLESTNSDSLLIDNQGKEYRLSLTLDFIDQITRSVETASPLRETFELGLRGGREQVTKRVFDSNYDISLINSDYLSPQQGSNSSKLASTLLKINNSSIKDIDLDGFGNDFTDASGNISISKNLLTTLLNNKEEAIYRIEQNPELYGLSINDDGLSWENLPTGIKVQIKTRETKNSKEEVKLIRKVGTAQLRVEESNIDIPQPPPPVEEPPPIYHPLPIPDPYEPPAIDDDTEDFIPGEPVIDPAPAIDGLEVEARRLDYRGHKFFYDENRPISRDNPLGMVNQERGVGYIHQGEDQHFNVSVGKFTKEAFEDIYFNESAEIGSIGGFDGNNLGNTQKITYDAMPRFHARYGKVTSDFVVNGVKIPTNSVIVGLNSSQARPKAKEFAQIRVYDANSGALITQFSPINQSAGKLSKIHFPYTLPGTTNDDGAKIFQHVSTAYLFNGEAPKPAVEKFLKIQADLATRTQSNINSRKNDWHRRVHDGYKRTGDSYDDAVLDILDDLEPRLIEEELRLGRGLTILEEQSAVRDYLNQVKAYIDDTALELEARQVLAMRELAIKREEIWAEEDKLEIIDLPPSEKKKIIERINILKKERKPLRAAYDKARKNYNRYMRERISPPGLNDSFTSTSDISWDDNISVEPREPQSKGSDKKPKKKKGKKR